MKKKHLSFVPFFIFSCADKPHNKFENPSPEQLAETLKKAMATTIDSSLTRLNFSNKPKAFFSSLRNDEIHEVNKFVDDKRVVIDAWLKEKFKAGQKDEDKLKELCKDFLNQKANRKSDWEVSALALIALVQNSAFDDFGSIVKDFYPTDPKSTDKPYEVVNLLNLAASVYCLNNYKRHLLSEIETENSLNVIEQRDIYFLKQKAISPAPSSGKGEEIVKRGKSDVILDSKIVNLLKITENSELTQLYDNSKLTQNYKYDSSLNNNSLDSSSAYKQIVCLATAKGDPNISLKGELVNVLKNIGVQGLANIEKVDKKIKCDGIDVFASFLDILKEISTRASNDPKQALSQEDLFFVLSKLKKANGDSNGINSPDLLKIFLDAARRNENGECNVPKEHVEHFIYLLGEERLVLNDSDLLKTTLELMPDNSLAPDEFLQFLTNIGNRDTDDTKKNFEVKQLLTDKGSCTAIFNKLDPTSITTMASFNAFLMGIFDYRSMTGGNLLPFYISLATYKIFEGSLQSCWSDVAKFFGDKPEKSVVFVHPAK